MEVMRLPQLGMTMESAEIIRWLKKESEPIALGEPLAEVQTEKAAVVVESAAEGILVRLIGTEGQTVAVDAPIAVIAAVGETVDQAAIDAILGIAPLPAASASTVKEAPPAAPASSARAPSSQGKATPRVRKLAQELKVDLAAVAPTGPGGVITEEDVRHHVAGPVSRIRERIPLSGIRKVMAAHMVTSWQSIPHFHQILDVDAGPLLRIRKEHPYSLTPFFVRAAALTLEKHPQINAVIEGNEVLLLREINVAVAVASPGGLVVPVIRDTNRKSVKEIAGGLEDLAGRAKEGRLMPDDFAGGTFTVSNLGMYGVESGFPIINAPQVALLFTGAIQSIPVFQNGEVVEGKRFKITVSFDHRVVDGVAAAEFSRNLRELLQDPAQLVADR